MNDKLNNLYYDCIKELESIGIKIIDNEKVGFIDISVSKRNNKRYGCCKQEDPDKNDFYIKKYKSHFKIVYNRFKKHHIEISQWVLDLDDKIIKNTIIHEILHCLPDCNNHGKIFQNYAKLINKKLGYNISTLGNKEEDYKKSNLNFEENNKNYKYKIICQKCGVMFYRQRLKKDLTKNYRCSRCGGKLEIV